MQNYQQLQKRKKPVVIQIKTMIFRKIFLNFLLNQ